MRLGRIWVAVAMTMASAVPVLGQDLSNLKGIAILTGVCERAIAGGTDMSEYCLGKLVQSIYSNGRTGFTATIGDKGTVLTFSGIEGAKPDADSQLQSVDKIILNLGIEGVEPSSADVTGGCAYSNPYKGPMTVSCQAVTAEGSAYLLQFRTDGSPPQITDLDQSQKDSKKSENRKFDIANWSGGPLDKDADGGCLMSSEINSKTRLYVYANGNEAFDISIFNDRWDFQLDAKIDGELLFDATTYPLSRIEVRNSKVLTLHGGAEEDSAEDVLARSSQLVFKTGRYQITANLRNSAAAVKRLWNCVNQ
jgi:hypothetical protein